MVCLFKGVPTESSENRVSEWLQGNLNEDGLSQLRVEYVLVAGNVLFSFNQIEFLYLTPSRSMLTAQFLPQSYRHNVTQ